jgi:predicted dehydrogenase
MSPARPLKVAIVGCGKIADGHVEEIRKLPELATIVGVCDRELLMAEQLAMRFALPRFFDSFETLLDSERPDVVHVTTPPQSHVALAKQALAAGCHVYVEKPFALDQAGAKEVLDLAAAVGRKVTVGYLSYFEPPALALREMVARGDLGTPVHVESFYGYDLQGGFGKAVLGDADHWVHRLPGKLFQNIIDHMLNKIVEFVTDDAPQVHAFASSLRSLRTGDVRDQLPDELRVVIRGAKVTGYGTFSSHIRPLAQFVRVYGTRNIAHVDYVARTVTLASSPRLPSAVGRLVPAFEQGLAHFSAGLRNVGSFAKSDFHFFAGMNHLISSFYKSILDGGDAPIPARDILRIAGLMDEIFRQTTGWNGRAP